MPLLVIFFSFVIAGLISGIIKKRRVIEGVSLAASIAALVSSVVIARRVADSGVYSPFAFSTVDALGAITILVVSIVGCAAMLYSIPYLRKETSKNIVGLRRIRQFYALTNLFLAAMFLSATASHPVAAWIFLEATTLSTAFLISYYNKRSTIEAAWKYLILNATGLLLAFFGTLLYFTAISHNAGFVSWQALTENAQHFKPAIAQIAFVFILIGYGTKVGLAPMHTWKPDAYSKSPAPIGALFSGALMPVALVTILRFKSVTDEAVGSAFSGRLLIVFGLLSVLIAAFSILTAKNYKRLLAYSSIEHAGIMALGFGFGGLGAFAALLHLIYHSFIKSALFFAAGNILIKFHSARIQKVSGAMSVIPVTGILFFAGLFAATGFPPFGIFLTELFTLSAGLKDYPLVAGLALAAIATLFIGFFRQANAMMFGQRAVDKSIKPGEGNIWLLIPPALLLALTLVATFYMPPFLQTLIHEATARY